jgi:hypothetical protein
LRAHKTADVSRGHGRQFSINVNRGPIFTALLWCRAACLLLFLKPEFFRQHLSYQIEECRGLLFVNQR